MPTTRSNRRSVAVLALAAPVLTLGLVAAPAAACPVKPPKLTLTGTGTWYERVPNDDPVVNGTATLATRGGRELQQLPLAATIDPDDFTLPESGTCEGATGGISIHDTRRSDMWLFGNGEVCGLHVQEPESRVRYAFTGSFLVEEGPRRLLGVDGFFEIRLGSDGTASVFAIDT